VIDFSPLAVRRFLFNDGTGRGLDWKFFHADFAVTGMDI
jgi:hypothetical protein